MTVDSSQLRQEIERRATAAFDIACNLMLGDTRDDAPQGETGDLKDSGEVEPGSGWPSFDAVLKFTAPQAEWTDSGTRDHGPVTASVLRFEIGGRVIFAKSVAGVTATHWFRDSVTDEHWRRVLADAWSQAG